MKRISFPTQSLMALLLPALMILTFTTSCTKASDTPGPNEVFIQGNAFVPATITVTAGTTIKWTNKDVAAHTVTSNTPGQFDSGSLGTNATWSHQFAAAGSYSYKCTFHTFMTGTVNVN